MKRIILVIVVMVCLICTSISGAEVINITGSSTIKPVVKAAGKVFKKKTGIKVVVKGGGSSVGVKTAEDGSSDIGAVSRKLKDSEPKDLVATLIGLDGVAVVLNTENKVSNLTKQQVFDIIAVRLITLQFQEVTEVLAAQLVISIRIANNDS